MITINTNLKGDNDGENIADTTMISIRIIMIAIMIITRIIVVITINNMINTVKTNIKIHNYFNTHVDIYIGINVYTSPFPPSNEAGVAACRHIGPAGGMVAED